MTNNYTAVPGLNETKIIILSALMDEPLYTADIVKRFGSTECYMGSVSVELSKLKNNKLIKSTVKIIETKNFGLPTRLLYSITKLGKKYLKTALMRDNADDKFPRMGIIKIAVLAAMYGNPAMNYLDFPKKPVIKNLIYPIGNPLANILYRMEKDGVVSSVLRPDLQMRGSRPPRYYTLTKLGKKYLELSLMIGLLENA